jgi:hypothetical protein
MNARALPVGPTCAPCVICARASRGFAFSQPQDRKATTFHFCSNACVEIFMNARSKNVTLTPAEDAAIEEAAMGAGRYASATFGHADLAALSKAEYLLYAAQLVTLYTEALRRLASEQVPF